MVPDLAGNTGNVWHLGSPAARVAGIAGTPAAVESAALATSSRVTPTRLADA